MWDKFLRVLPHINIMLALVTITLWIFDRFNPVMRFIGMDIFKIPLLIFMVLVVVQAIALIARQRRD